MPKNKRMNVAFMQYECPYCHVVGSIGFRTDADEDQHFTTACEHKVPITVEGRLAQKARAEAHAQEGEG